MTTLPKISIIIVALCAAISTFATNPALPLLNEPVDVSPDFRDFSDLYYLADRLADFDPAMASGKITYQRAEYFTRQAFDNMLAVIKPVGPNEFPEDQYAVNPALPFSIEFVSPRTLRIRATSGPQVYKQLEELMLAGPVPKDDSWKYGKIEGGHRYTSQFGSMSIMENPWRIVIRDANGKLLTETDHASDNTASFTPIMPFAFVRRAADYSRSMNAAFALSPGEKIFGCDNNTFIVESFLPSETDVKISIAGGGAKLRNLVTGEILTGQPGNNGGRGRRGGRDGGGDEPRLTFNAHMPPHSYAVFAVEK